MYTIHKGIEEIKNNSQVNTTQEGINELKSNPRVNTTPTKAFREDIKNSPQVYTA